MESFDYWQVDVLLLLPAAAQHLCQKVRVRWKDGRGTVGRSGLQQHLQHGHDVVRLTTGTAMPLMEPGPEIQEKVVDPAARGGLCGGLTSWVASRLLPTLRHTPSLCGIPVGVSQDVHQHEWTFSVSGGAANVSLFGQEGPDS
ncbi:hypothetical protein GCM10011359_15410 [Nesterenkonia alkaliphila]|nr:hypothetical protein GCM10011359_15410 [Nesterenkonia alkaliphila]